jgi:hypothetical protein
MSAEHSTEEQTTQEKRSLLPRNFNRKKRTPKPKVPRTPAAYAAGGSPGGGTQESYPASHSLNVASAHPAWAEGGGPGSTAASRAR